MKTIIEAFKTVIITVLLIIADFVFSQLFFLCKWKKSLKQFIYCNYIINCDNFLSRDIGSRSLVIIDVDGFGYFLAWSV